MRSSECRNRFTSTNAGKCSVGSFITFRLKPRICGFVEEDNLNDALGVRVGSTTATIERKGMILWKQGCCTLEKFIQAVCGNFVKRYLNLTLATPAPIVCRRYHLAAQWRLMDEFLTAHSPIPTIHQLQFQHMRNESICSE